MLGTIKTSRLCLRPILQMDAPFILQLLNTPGWLRFIGDRGVKTHESAVNYINNHLRKSYEVNGFGAFLIELVNERLPIGMAGLFKRNGLNLPDLGYALMPAFYGKGFAYEAANATLDFARDKIGLKEVAAITNVDNENSIKLLQKLGFVFDTKITLPNTEEELSLFKVKLYDSREHAINLSNGKP